jgi:hypothetical protein
MPQHYLTRQLLTSKVTGNDAETAHGVPKV